MSFSVDKNLFSYQVDYNNYNKRRYSIELDDREFISLEDEIGDFYDNAAIIDECCVDYHVLPVYAHDTLNKKDEGIEDDILREDVEIEKNNDELQEGFYNWSNFTIKV